MMKLDWFGVLKGARAFSGGDGKSFTAPGLAEALGINGKIASAWLYKFKRWGYVKVTGTVLGNSIRPLNVFVVTEKGMTCEARRGRREQLEVLVQAVRAYEVARGGKEEPAAWKALLRACLEAEK